MMKKMMAIVATMIIAVSLMVMPASAADREVTVHAKVPAAWTDVALWAWEGADNFTGGAWPGTAMTKDGDWYTTKIKVSSDKFSAIISNNGAGEQTNDITGITGNEVWITVGTVADGKADGTFTTTDPAAPAPAPSTPDTDAPTTGTGVLPVVAFAVVALGGVVAAKKFSK